MTMRRISVYCLAMVFLMASVVLAQNVQKDQPVDAKALFESKCSTCHSINRPMSKKKTEEKWTKTVARMRKWWGCVLTDEEAKIIVDYLFKNYGKE
jgi:mono/diheme cytochrome c family protein